MFSLIHNTKDNSSSVSFLKQNFYQLSKKGQSQLKDYLKSLVSLQNTITEKISLDNSHDSSKET
jgi:ribosomal protein S18